jgi:ribose-phosphate pyrophosphokinase
MILIGSNSTEFQLNNYVSTRLGIQLAPCTLEKFSNGETKVIIGVSVRGQDVYVLSTGYQPINDNLMETLMICKACRMSNASSITLIMVNYPYARQDRKTKSRECITSAFVGELIEIAGVNRMITFDLHAQQIQGMLRIPVDNLYTYKLFADYLRLMDNSIRKETHIVIAPDAGATKRCRELANNLGISMALIEKTRNYQNGDQIERMILIDQDHSVENKIAIIHDDIADTLGTLTKACELLKENKVKEVIAVVTHGILSGQAIKRLEECSILSKLICTNSVPIPLHKKIFVCDLSSLISAGIQCLENGTSMSALFK